jgi:hypothetical protein
MTTGTTDNVRNWSGAKIFIAPRGSTGPTNLEDPWDDAFEPAGILDEDSGIDEAMSRSVTHHYGYGVGEVRATVKEQQATVGWASLELVPVVYDLVYPGGAGSTTSGVTTRTRRHYTPNPKAFGLEKTDGTIVSRLWIPKGEVVEAAKQDTNKDDSVAMVSLVANCFVFDLSTLAWATEITSDPAAVVS